MLPLSSHESQLSRGSPRLRTRTVLPRSDNVDAAPFMTFMWVCIGCVNIMGVWMAAGDTWRRVVGLKQKRGIASRHALDDADGNSRGGSPSSTGHRDLSSRRRSGVASTTVSVGHGALAHRRTTVDHEASPQEHSSRAPTAAPQLDVSHPAVDATGVGVIDSTQHGLSSSASSANTGTAASSGFGKWMPKLLKSNID